MIKIIKTLDKRNEFLNTLESRAVFDNGNYLENTKMIVNDVKANGDSALFKYTKMFDNVILNSNTVKLPYSRLEEAYYRINAELKDVLMVAKERIEDFHKTNLQTTWIKEKENGEILGQKITPLNRVGVYVPGGSAAYPSSVLMNIVPAVVAGVKEIIMVTPPSKNLSDEVLAAAYIAGVKDIYQIGGAQAIAALAYGTESIPKVDKIVGPGNIYVTLAKKEVFGIVAIDSIAGPSEILIIADHSANPTFVAADLLSQAEHDKLASAIVITLDDFLAENIKKEVNRLYISETRQDIIASSLLNYGAIIIADNIDEACCIANEIAPEHLELAVSDPFIVMDKITNAGAIFLGHYTPEAVGDYIAGPNHVLPTNKTAKFFSPLNTDDFQKKSSIIYFTKENLEALGDKVELFASAEKLTAHANSVRVRKGK